MLGLIIGVAICGLFSCCVASQTYRKYQFTGWRDEITMTLKVFGTAEVILFALYLLSLIG